MAFRPPTSGVSRTLPPNDMTVTASLISGRAAIVLLSAPVPEPEVAEWLAELSRRFGTVEPRRAQGLETWQWVRRGRMVRVTTRAERGTLVVSVSLVDGPLLDGLDGKDR